MEIKIEVKRNGMLTGSCGWVAERLKKAEVEIIGKRLYVVYENGKDKEGNTKITKESICGIVDAGDWGMFARTTNDGKFWFAYPYDEDFGMMYQKITLFGCPLTDAAWRIADDFIKKCLDAFRYAWENDKEEEVGD